MFSICRYAGQRELTHDAIAAGALDETQSLFFFLLWHRVDVSRVAFARVTFRTHSRDWFNMHVYAYPYATPRSMWMSAEVTHRAIALN